jgi:hypothetical protein
MAVAIAATAGVVEPLPFATTANLADTPQILVDGAVYSGDGITGYGVRGQYKLSDGLAVFGSLNIPEEGLGFSGGAIYGLPFDLPVSTAVRGGLGYWSDDSGGVDMSAIDLNGAAVASGMLDSLVDGLSWYGNAGFHYVKWEAEYKWGGMPMRAKAAEDDWADWGLDDLVIPSRTVKADDSDLIIHIGAGLVYDITDLLSVFGGIDMFSGDYIDDTFIGGGVRVGFGGGAAGM